MFRIAVFFLSGIISYLVTGWLAVAPTIKLDLPNARSSHTRPTPRMGGLGIVAAFIVLLPMLLVMLWPTANNWRLAVKFGAALCGYVLIAAVGLVDDLRHLSARTKFFGQLLAALIAIWGGVYFHFVELPLIGRVGWEAWWTVCTVVTILWLVGFSNFFNFMDGIDGLTGGVGAIYSLALAWICFGTSHRLLGAGSLMLAAGCLGFLAHNFPPAKIFMGDVGSLFVGFALAAFAVYTTNSGSHPAPFLAVALVFSTFLHDATFTLLRRLRKGERIYEAHRSHLYQRLIIAGQSHARVSLTYYALSAALACGGVVYTFAGDINTRCDPAGERGRLGGFHTLCLLV